MVLHSEQENEQTYLIQGSGCLKQVNKASQSFLFITVLCDLSQNTLTGTFYFKNKTIIKQGFKTMQ